MSLFELGPAPKPTYTRFAKETDIPRRTCWVSKCKEFVLIKGDCENGDLVVVGGANVFSSGEFAISVVDWRPAKVTVTCSE